MLSAVEEQRIRWAVDAKAYALPPPLATSLRSKAQEVTAAMVGRPSAEQDIALLLDELDRLRLGVAVEWGLLRDAAPAKYPHAPDGLTVGADLHAYREGLADLAAALGNIA